RISIYRENRGFLGVCFQSRGSPRAYKVIYVNILLIHLSSLLKKRLRKLKTSRPENERNSSAGKSTRGRASPDLEPVPIAFRKERSASTRSVFAPCPSRSAFGGDAQGDAIAWKGNSMVTDGHGEERTASKSYGP